MGGVDVVVAVVVVVVRFVGETTPHRQDGWRRGMHRHSKTRDDPRRSSSCFVGVINASVGCEGGRELRDD
jgi:hypothetical protein